MTRHDGENSNVRDNAAAQPRGDIPPDPPNPRGKPTEPSAARSRRERLSEWYHGEIVLDTPMWCRPRFKPVGPGVSVKTTYGYHVIIALVYTAWKVRRV